MSKHPDTLPYNPEISKEVFKLAAAGVIVRDIFSAIQRFSNAPGSLTTFYKLYRNDMDRARVERIEAVGNRVLQQALEGDPKEPSTFKSQDLYLRSHGGWSPKTTEESREVGTEEEETESAVEALLKALGKNTE